jgi:antitoxin component YwqK of YwqJK toxin-antitoxin module
MLQNNTIDTVEVKKEYYASGALLAEIPRVNGERHGIVKTYNETGTLYAEVPFVKGKAHGIKKRYDKDNSNIDRLTLYNRGREVAFVKI